MEAGGLLPPDEGKALFLFSTITAKMNLSDEVDLEDYVARPDRISGADINAITSTVSFVSLGMIDVPVVVTPRAAFLLGTLLNLNFAPVLPPNGP